MKTKLLFSTIQNCKNGIFMVLVLFFMITSSLGQSFIIESDCVVGPYSDLTFEFDTQSTTSVNLGDVLSNGVILESGWKFLVIEADINEPIVYFDANNPGGGTNYTKWVLQQPTGERWFFTIDENFPTSPCDATWVIDTIIGGGRPCTALNAFCTQPTPTWYQDSDMDTFGNPLVSQVSETQPAGYVEDKTDCDDGDAEINPDTIWYLDDDNDNYAISTTTQCTSPGTGYTTTMLSITDCDDTEPLANPGLEEIPFDTIDNDCDGEIDEDDNPPVVLEYCDDKQKKILICHKGKTKCVSINAMDAHLAHGDYLGPCGSNSKEGDTDIAEDVPTSYYVVSWPNPTNDSFNVKMITPNTTNKVSINAFDINGRLIHSNVINGNEYYQFGSKLSSGVYFVRLSQANKIEVIRVIKQ